MMFNMAMSASLVITGTYILLAAGLSLYVLTQRREPANTLAWILGFFLFPYVGVLLYAFFGYQRYRRKRKPIPHPLGTAMEDKTRIARFSVPSEMASEVRHMSKLSEHLTSFPALGGNQAEFYLQPEDSLNALVAAIGAAEHHVHLSFYFVRNDAAGHAVAHALIRAAQRGVSCRILLDGVGCWGLGRDYLDPLKKAGVRVAFFSPLKRFKRLWHLHLRNHRKLAILDGQIGFIGSQNLVDNFTPVPPEDRPWLEIVMKVRGPIVHHLQTIFAEDWRYSTGESPTGAAYYPVPSTQGPLQMQAVPTGPDLPEESLHLIFLSMIHAAQNRVTIVTPYLVPSQPVALALEGAARRGVRVSVLLPEKTDNVLAHLAGRSGYPALLEAGIHLYEHPRTPLHAKAVLVDDHLALIGSANMDVRSFRLNFEAGIILYGPEPANTLQAMADAAIRQSRRIVRHKRRWTTPLTTVAEGLARLLSPLL